MFRAITEAIKELVIVIGDLTDSVDDLAKVVRLRQPGLVFLQFVREGFNGMKEFKLVLPPATARDVQFFEVELKVGDKDPVTLHPANVDYGKDPVNTSEIAGLQAENGTIVTGTLRDLDDAGNKSPAREFSLTVSDTNAPPMPGEVVLEITNEAVNIIDTPIDPVP
jgi:hypothetical protein